MLRAHLLSLGGWTLWLGALGCSSEGDDPGSTGGTGGNGRAGESAKAGGSGKAGGASSSGGSANPTTNADTFGEAHEGQYHLGPVDFAETEWHNACAPGGNQYRKELQPSVGLLGEFLAGVSNQFAEGGGSCDACILIETAKGKSIVARVVTYGVEHEPGDIDVSPSVFAALHQDEFPRSMTWHFARCPDVGGVKYEFQTEANPYWTSLWLRNPRVPLTKLEVKSANHASFVELQRGPDGSLTDESGFDEGPFTFRATALDGQTFTDELPGFQPGALVQSNQQFD